MPEVTRHKILPFQSELFGLVAVTSILPREPDRVFGDLMDAPVSNGCAAHVGSEPEDLSSALQLIQSLPEQGQKSLSRI
jgi:hypothetical protein